MKTLFVVERQTRGRRRTQECGARSGVELPVDTQRTLPRPPRALAGHAPSVEWEDSTRQLRCAFRFGTVWNANKMYNEQLPEKDVPLHSCSPAPTIQPDARVLVGSSQLLQ